MQGKKRRILVTAVALLLTIGGTIGGFELSQGPAKPAPTLTTPASSGLPTSSSFFPIAVFDQSPSGGDVQAPYTNQAQAMAAEGININIGENSNSEVTADLEASCAAGTYLFGGNSVTAATVPVVEADANAADSTAYPNCSKNMVAYQVGDEGCSSTTPGLLAGVMAADPTRLANWGQSGGFPAAMPCPTIAAASSIVSGDVYENINTYIGAADSTCNVKGGQSDCTYGYGIQTSRYVAAAGGKPVWTDVETGSDALGFSEAQGACNSTTNLCPQGNEQRATPEQVDSDVWLSIINGAKGIIYFCDDSTTGADACLGGGANGNPSACAPTCDIAANLTYIDSNVSLYAPELNSSNTSGVTVSSSNSAVPVDEMTKVVGNTTYIFTEADRGAGTTTATYTDPALAGQTATLVYDSASQYDSSQYKDVGSSFAINSSGAFSDSLTGDTGNALNAISYQVKIYEVNTPATTTTTQAPTTTTTAPVTTTTTTVPPVNETVSCSGVHYVSGSSIYMTCKGFPTTEICTGAYKSSGTYTLSCKE